MSKLSISEIDSILNSFKQESKPNNTIYSIFLELDVGQYWPHFLPIEYEYRRDYTGEYPGKQQIKIEIDNILPLFIVDKIIVTRNKIYDQFNIIIKPMIDHWRFLTARNINNYIPPHIKGEISAFITKHIQLIENNNKLFISFASSNNPDISNKPIVENLNQIITYYGLQFNSLLTEYEILRQLYSYYFDKEYNNTFNNIKTLDNFEEIFEEIKFANFVADTNINFDRI